LRPITTAWSAFVKSTDSTFLSRDEVVHEDGTNQHSAIPAT
jgi:hypothetical protein